MERKPDALPHIPESEAAVSWGLSPTGAWGRLVPGPLRPLLFDQVSGEPITAIPQNQAIPEDGPPELLYDWGHEVVGYLTIQVPLASEMQVGLLYTGDTPPDPHRERPASPVLVMPRQKVWRAARPGRFRYALVAGIANSAGATVQPVDPALLPRLFPAARGPKGVFGITPPPLRTPVENRVWGRSE